MRKLNGYAFTLTILDLLRFGFSALFFLPIFANSFSVTEGSTSNYRLLLWLSAPQLIIPTYTGAIALGFINDELIKQIGIAVKCLSLIPGIALLVTFIMPLFQMNSDESYLLLIIRLIIALLFDILFCVMLLMYRKKPLKD